MKDLDFDAILALSKVNARFYRMQGRDVLLIPITRIGYPFEVHDMDYQEWVLVIEKDGTSWIWDSWMMEG